MFKLFCLITLLGNSPLVWAAATTATPTGDKNYSGSYSCKGNNSKVGDYAYTLNLKLNKAHSHDEISVYELAGETENSTLYSGNGVAIANRMSMAFRVSDHKDNIFGSGFAMFKSNPEKLWTFTTHYYEPSETGGASGTDICTQNPPAAPKKPTDEAAPKKAAEEPVNKKPVEDNTTKKPAEETTPKKAADDSVSKKPVEDTVTKKAADDTAARKSPVEAAPKKAADEATRN